MKFDEGFRKSSTESRKEILLSADYIKAGLKQSVSDLFADFPWKTDPWKIPNSCFNLSVLGFISEDFGDNSLKNRAWSTVAGMHPRPLLRLFMLLTVPFIHNHATSGWRGLQDHQCALIPGKPPTPEINKDYMVFLLSVSPDMDLSNL